MKVTAGVYTANLPQLWDVGARTDPSSLGTDAALKATTGANSFYVFTYVNPHALTTCQPSFQPENSILAIIISLK